MTRSLAFTDVGSLDARDWPRLTTRLLLEGRPRFVCARLSGVCLALGRWERARSVLTPYALERAPVRRTTGGRTLALGGGQVALALVTPSLSWLTGETLPASSVLNRHVRGMLSGLARLGVGAQYFGRDFVTVDSAQAGHLSFDIDANGHVLVECVLAVGAHWQLPEHCDALPPLPAQRGVPGPGMVPELRGDVLEAMRRGHVERYGVEAEVVDAGWELAEDVPDPVERGGRSRLHAVATGWVEAMTDGQGVTICGSFLADSAGMARLQEATADGFEARLAEVLSRPEHAMLGVTDPGVLVQAVREASCS